MSERKSRAVFRRALVGGLLCAAGLLASVSHAVVTSSGLGTQVNVVGTDYNISGGTRPNNGTNLFHSFGDFSLDMPESANFLNDSPGLATTNILSRVTGGNPSNIFGTIDTSAFPGANLFLMNPAGILFGPTAQLNVAGSFHATTADYIGLADGTHFNAIPSAGADALLTAAVPSAFGFLNSNPAPIDVQAGTFDLISTFQFTNVFQVPEGQTLSFVGGDLNVGSPDLLPPGAPPAPGGFVFAPGGTVNLVSVASPGEATFDNSTITVDGFAQLGNINIMGGGIVDGKEVFIRGGQLSVQDATVFPGLFWLAGEPVAPPDGGGVNIEVSGAVNITSVVGPILTFPGIETQGGSTAGVVLGDVPNIEITAGSLSVSDGGRILSTRLGPGNPPDLLIQASTVEVRNGSAISLVNLFEGPGGTLTVNAHDVTLDSEGSAGITGLQAQSNFNPAYGQPGVPYLPFFQDADSGSITVNADGQLTVLNRAQISADSFAFGQGGSVTVNAGDMLLVGAGTNTAAITSQSGLGGQSGDVTVNAARTIDMQNGFRISANTFGSGDGGAVNVTAGQSITMSGDFTQISSATDQPLDSDLNGFAEKFGGPGYDYSTLRADLGIAPATGDLMQVLESLNGITDFAGFPLVILTDFTPGDAGQVSVATPVLNVTNDAVIQTSTAWDGDAGAIALNVGSLSLDNGGSVRSRNGNVRLDRGPTVGAGNAGQIDVTATDTISISGRSPTTGESSFVSTSTFGDGNAGSVSLSANQVNVESGGVVSSTSGGTLGGQFFAGTGSAGNISITTAGTNNAITVSGVDSTISTATFGDGAGGSIELNTNQIEVLGGGSVTAQTGGTVEGSFFAGTGAGGSVTFKADDTVSISGSGSTVSVTTSGAGQGGDIELNGNEVAVTDGGSVTAETSSTGDAGIIGIAAADLLSISGNNSTVSTTTSGGGAGGDIALTSNEVDISGGGSVTAEASSTGDAGTIGIAAADMLSVSGTNSTVSTTTSGGGAGGDIALTSNEVDISGGGSVTAEASSTGDAGTIVIAATGPDTLTISGAGSAVSTTTSGEGAGGSITLDGDQVEVTDGGSVTAETTAAGNAGTVTITATGPLTVSGTNSTVSTTTSGAGQGGDIELSGDGVSVSGGGSVTAEASSTGNAGIVDITATGGSTLTISDPGSTVSTTTSGAGAGGSIALAGNLIQVLNGGSVTADSFGTGFTGNITMTAGNSITLNNGTISTRAETSDGGNIKLTAPGQQVYLLNSDITTSVESGEGGGGNINIDPEFLILNHSDITANAFGGPGGNITLIANNFIASSDSTVQASSALSTQGTIVIQSPENDIAGGIAQLPQSIVDVSGLLPESCAARHAAGGAQSSFVVAGRGGLPTNPDNYLPSFGAGSGPMKSGGMLTPRPSRSELGYINDTTVAMAGWGCIP